MVPKAPDKWGIVNVSSKRQVERLPVDDNDNVSLEDNDNSDEDGSGPPLDEEEDVVDTYATIQSSCLYYEHKTWVPWGMSNVPTQR